MINNETKKTMTTLKLTNPKSLDKKTLKGHISHLLEITPNDVLIHFANHLGLAEYFANLKSIDDMTKKELTICLTRLHKVTDLIIKHYEYFQKRNKLTIS